MKSSYLVILILSLYFLNSCDSDNTSTTLDLCTDELTIVPFEHNEKKYEFIRLNKTWSEASAYAVERNGYLVEINSVEEQTAIFNELMSICITNNNTIAPDGGGASYVWLGGNDNAIEGDWIWDGDNDSIGTQFWKGTKLGNAVNSNYNNWGDEPDDFGSGQDGLGLALTDWPLGKAGEWNDVKIDNSLCFIIEFDSTSSEK